MLGTSTSGNGPKVQGKGCEEFAMVHMIVHRYAVKKESARTRVPILLGCTILPGCTQPNLTYHAGLLPGCSVTGRQVRSHPAIQSQWQNLLSGMALASMAARAIGVLTKRCR